MNIKYRLLCKRLIEERKRVGVIQYYNVLFIMELVSDKDIWSWDYVMEQKKKTEWDLTHQGDHNPYADLPKMHIYSLMI